MKGSPFYRNFGIGSPNKQTTVYEGRDNEKGQSQKDVLEKRNKDITDYDDAVSEYKNEEGKLDITEAQYEAYKKKRQALIDAQKTSTDSINTANKNMNLKIEADKKKKKEDAEKKKKKADDSGLFMKSPSKQFEEGDYYDTRSKKSPNKQVGPRNKKGDFVQIQNKDAAGPGPEITTTVSGKLPEGVYIGKDGELKNKDGYNYNLSNATKKSFESVEKNTKKLKAASPNKQRDLGGTKSGKGNVFTKRGRTQKKINAEKAETAKLRKEHIAENKRSTYLATKDHEEKMIKKQLKNRPKTVVMKGDKDVTKKYR